ncbi:glycosyltransferase family 2 protein [Candidatus Microgenomates bacterium]|nr:glycosyltransferase family 2 protein [Candidatus Microgenomates bacterium]
MIHLSVIVPCYNEQENLQKGSLFRINDYLTKANYTWEVIIVDDGSTDASREQIEKFISVHRGFRLVKNSHQGKAQAVITGVNLAQGQLVLFQDLDQATPIEEVEKLLPFIEKGYSVVIGSRNTRREGSPFLRLLMSRGFMLLRTFILGLGEIRDTQCGFKLFTKEAVKEIFPKLRLYLPQNGQVHGPMVTAGFDVEVLYLAKKFRFKIKEVPVFWHYVETRRVNPVTESINGLLDMLKLKVNNLKGYYS